MPIPVAFSFQPLTLLLSAALLLTSLDARGADSAPLEREIAIEVFQDWTTSADAFDLFALQASSRKLELTYHIEPEVPAWILSDVTRLRQIIVNLVAGYEARLVVDGIELPTTVIGQSDVDPNLKHNNR